jgi:hypothetical protein
LLLVVEGADRGVNMIMAASATVVLLLREMRSG